MRINIPVSNMSNWIFIILIILMLSFGFWSDKSRKNARIKKNSNIILSEFNDGGKVIAVNCFQHTCLCIIENIKGKRISVGMMYNTVVVGDFWKLTINDSGEIIFDSFIKRD